MDRLSEIRARCDAATPEEWGVGDGSQEHYYRGRNVVISRLRVVAERAIYDGGEVDEQTFADMRFIAHAREDIPYLLEQNEAATARAEKAEAERDTANKCIRDTETYFDLGTNKFAYRTIKQYTHDVMEAQCTES